MNDASNDADLDSAPQEFPQRSLVPPEGSTRVLLVRHGQTVAAQLDEPFPLVDGHGDPVLTELGHRQAELTAQRLALTEITGLYVTTLVRTVQTAEPLARRLGITPSVEPDLREVFLGEFEGGRFRIELENGHEAFAEVWRSGTFDAIPGAETWAQLAERAQNGLRRIVARHPGETVVVVSHGGAIGALIASLTGATPLTFFSPANCSISELLITPEQAMLRRFNDSGHLDIAGATTMT